MMVWACMAANGTNSLVFIDDCSKMISEVRIHLYSAHIQSNRTHFTVQMGNALKHAADLTQDFLKTNKWKILQCPSHSTDLNTIAHLFS